MTNLGEPEARFEIHSAERGPHWIAWLEAGSAGAPIDAVVLVVETREEAEERARLYAERIAARGGH